MIWNKVELIEPECRNLGEDLSPGRDCVWENAVESGDAVRCDDEEIFAELKPPALCRCGISESQKIAGRSTMQSIYAGFDHC